MQTEELRIGNWVIDHNGECRQIISLHFTWDYDHLSPIPLTEEILLNCGFEYCDNGYYKYLIISEYNYLIISRTNTIYIADCPSLNGINIELHEVELLHQLQNLYFALTNQDLNVEL